MNLLETKRGNVWLGAAYYYYSRFGFYLGIPSMVLTLAIFWQTGGWKYLSVPFYVVVIVFFLISLIILVFDHKYATPAICAWNNKILKEQNPVLEEIKELRKEISELKEMVN